jgi:hypothetical protein
VGLYAVQVAMGTNEVRKPELHNRYHRSDVRYRRRGGHVHVDVWRNGDKIEVIHFRWKGPQ